MNIIKVRQELAMGKNIYDMPLRVVDYGRVSTDKDEQLNSLTNQANYFNDMIDGIKNWNHVGSYADEGISGTQVYKREDFLRMIEDARLGKFDMIVTKEISRFARNTIDSIKYTQLLLSYGVIVFFISDNINTINPDSEFRLTLMASMAQDEVRKLSERVKFGIRRSIKDGKLGGGNLYGYNKKDCVLTINEDEAKVVKKIFELYASGEYGFTKIGEMLANEGHYTRAGKVFSMPTLKKMIRNPRYKGWFTANLSEVEDYKTHKKINKPREEWIMYKDESGRVPAIIDEELWDKANQVHNERMSKWNKNVLNKEFYLENRNYTSKIFCMEHNTTFIRSASCKRKENPVWQCNEFLRHGIKGCATPRLFEKHLDEIFATMLEKIVDNRDEILNSITNDYVSLIKESNNSYDVDNLKAKLREQQTLKDRLLDMSLRNMINDNEFMEKNKSISDEIASLNKQILVIESNKESTAYYDKIVEQIRNELKPKLDIRKNIGKYFNLFIDKVFVSKIDNDRKHIKLQMIFNFKREDEEIEIHQRNNSNGTGSDNSKNEKTLINQRDYNVRVSFDTNYLRQKYLLLNAQQPRFC
ncbi:MAG: recombinase family protein [Bacilli bacterium]|nr:recombinase family protein [Bacilli bacterium]